MFAVNFGEVGFLATLDPDGLDADFDRAFAGGFDALELPGIAVGRPEGTWTAINDISVHRKPGFRVADLAYALAGEEVGRVRCDGLVVSTPAGLDGLQPRQRRAGAGLGRCGLRGLVHRTALADGARAGGRARRPADDQQPLARRAGRGRTSTGAPWSSSRPARTSTSSSRARRRCSRSCRARASTTACASASAAWRASGSRVARVHARNVAAVADNAVRPSVPTVPDPRKRRVRRARLVDLVACSTSCASRTSC